MDLSILICISFAEVDTLSIPCWILKGNVVVLTAVSTLSTCSCSVNLYTATR